MQENHASLQEEIAALRAARSPRAPTPDTNARGYNDYEGERGGGEEEWAYGNRFGGENYNMHGFGNGGGGRFGNGYGVNGRNGGRGLRDHGGRNYFERERYMVNHEEEHGPRYEDPTKSIKHTLPEFHGNYDPAACLEWLSQVERIFDVHRYTEGDKVKLAVAEFRGYAHVWWTDIVRRRRALLGGEVEDWNTLKALMETAFVPKAYFVKLRHELQELKQGTKKIMEYYQEILIMMNKVGKIESESDIQDRFIHGLNTHFKHRVQLEAF